MPFHTCDGCGKPDDCFFVDGQLLCDGCADAAEGFDPPHGSPCDWCKHRWGCEILNANRCDYYEGLVLAAKEKEKDLLACEVCGFKHEYVHVHGRCNRVLCPEHMLEHLASCYGKPVGST